ncbi:MAG TPA: hypothetical protein VN808_15625 [Stellaceae bacterium]|nr:hypothetical protein [Stellaceae bacterium]
MTKLRNVRLAAVVACVVALAAGPALADGLSRFEKSIKPQIPAGTLTYKSSKALGDNGFVLSDAVVTPPPTDKDSKDPPQPINIKTITVEDLDFDAIEKQQPPLYAKVKIEGVATGSNLGGAFDLKQLAGLDKLAADFQLDYRLVPDKQTFTLNRLELNLTGLAKLDTSMVLDGISPDVTAKPDTAMQDASLKSAAIVYDDHSLLSKVIPIVAAMQGSDPKALIAMATLMLDTARAGQSAASQKAIDTLVAFCEDYQKPKGPLKIALNPPDKVTNAQLGDAKTADEYIKLLGIEVSYAGTRTSTPMDIPAATTPPDDKGPLDKKKE